MFASPDSGAPGGADAGHPRTRGRLALRLLLEAGRLLLDRAGREDSVLAATSAGRHVLTRQFRETNAIIRDLVWQSRSGRLKWERSGSAWATPPVECDVRRPLHRNTPVSGETRTPCLWNAAVADVSPADLVARYQCHARLPTWGERTDRLPKGALLWGPQQLLADKATRDPRRSGTSILRDRARIAVGLAAT